MTKISFCLSCFLLVSALRCGAATFTVTNTLDSGTGSLRAAITTNNITPGGTNVIHFNIAPLDGTVKTITLSSQLPSITRPVIIDGYTQPNSSPNTLTNADNAVLLIEINGAAMNIAGLPFVAGSGGSTVRGLVINSSTSGVLFESRSNTVEGCFLGVDPTGLIARVTSKGVDVEAGDGSFSRIGGTTPEARNIILGNNNLGVLIASGAGSNCVVQGNFIGVDATGTNALSVSSVGGVDVFTTGNLIGGTNAAARNIIAGGGGFGVRITESAATGNFVQGNYIGTDFTGSKKLATIIAVYLLRSSGTQVGGLASPPGTPPGNVIVGQGDEGVEAGGSDNNVIQGNLIGTDATGTKALTSEPFSGAAFGIELQGFSNVVGGPSAGARNVISGHNGMGVYVSVAGNLVQGNFIGTDITGTNLLGNGTDGVRVGGSGFFPGINPFNNTIQSNVIAGNASSGVNILAGTNNTVLGNSIFGNGSIGVNIGSPSTGVSVLSNSIFGNGGLGIDLLGNGVTPNDAGDVDDGPNHLQNFPVITGVALGGGNVTLSGSLNSSNNAFYRLEFFSNPSCDSSGNGEGKTFLGFVNVTTDGSGNVNFTNTFPNGSDSTFTATATDTNGNTSEFSACAFVAGPCSFTGPANMVVPTAANQCGAVVNFSTTTSGNCGGVTCSPASGSFFPKGTNTVICTAASGTNYSFTVAVNDIVPPTIACPANVVTNVPADQTNAMVSYPAAVFSDNCALATTNCSPASGTSFPLGVTTVTCSATDTSGNSNACSFTVTVEHTNTPPVARCHDVTTNANANCQADVPAATVDNGSSDSDGTITNRTLSPPGPYPKGTTAVTLTVVDNQGASNSCGANIIVLDITRPSITCSIFGNADIVLPPGRTNVALQYFDPVVTDNCGVASTNCSPASGSTFQLGVTTVTCTATDTSSNTASCSFTLTLIASADHFWTNALGGNYPAAGNWLGGLVPGAADNANFTNNASYQVNWTSSAVASNAFFNAHSGSVTQSIGAFSWLLTNSCVVGQNFGSTAAVTHTSGTLLVTNSAGTAPLVIGQSGKATYSLDGGTVIADKLFVTNNGATFTNSTFNFDFGSLTTLHGSVITQAASLFIGTVAGQTATWNVLGGTNTLGVALGSGILAVGGPSGARGALLASGSTTVLSNSSGIDVGDQSSLNTLTISNGARVSAVSVSVSGPFTNNVLTVEGSNSFLAVGVPGLGGAMSVGNSGSNNQLLIINGGVVSDSKPYIGNDVGGNGNLVQVSGLGSAWLNSSTLSLGASGASNHLVIDNGGSVTSVGTSVGAATGANANSALVSGAGSLWTENGQLSLGWSVGNSLTISNGGQLHGFIASLGVAVTSSNNLALVTGAGSVWSNSSSLTVGQFGAASSLIVSNGGAVIGPSVIIGSQPGTSNNVLSVAGGTLEVTNVSATGVLDIRRGTNQLNSDQFHTGLLEVDRLLVTNALGFFEFNGGTLETKITTISNGATFFVGNGVRAAALTLVGNGTHSFANGLTIRSNGWLNGSGTVSAFACSGTVQPVGRLIVSSGAATFNGGSSLLVELFGSATPGTDYGQLQVSTPPDLSGARLDVSPVYSPVVGERFVIITNTGTTAFATTFAGLPEGAFFTNAGAPFQITYAGGDGNDVVLTRVSGPPPPPPPPPAIPLSGGAYTQDFNTLATNGTANTWSNGFTLFGWYAAQGASPFTISTYRVSAGGDNTGDLYSFGSTNSTERALGSIASGTPGTIGFGVCFTNDTAASASNFTIAYTGEQWRSGGSGSVTNTLSFWYRVSPSALTNPEPDIVVNWTALTNLDFVSPTVIATGTALDGNQATNRHMFAAISIPGLVVPSGEEVFFRWMDPNDAGSDEGMAVDDLTVAFSILAPRITSITSNPTNHFAQITGQGEGNFTYGIQAASNLNSPIFWQRIGSNTANGAGLFQFTDTNAPAFRMRFYRALSP